MAFTDFTSITQVQETFDIKYMEEDYIQYNVDIEPSPAFLEEFRFSQQHIDVFASETSRCENVIYPILRDVYKNYADCFSLWSHKSIAYDAQLSGTPDYLISTKSALGKTVLGTPIIVVVEAKRNDFIEGWRQCLAELVAVQRINDDPLKSIYGIDKKLQESAAHNLEVAFFVRRLGDVLPNPWHASRIVKATLTAYREEGIDEETLYTHRLYLSEYLKRRLHDRIDKLAEIVFREKLEAGKIQFNLQADDALNYEMEKILVVNLTSEAKPLTRSHGEPLQQNLFEQVFEAEFNNLETDFALYLDKQRAIQWWHRIAAKQGYFLQGWRRDRVYPDFIPCLQRSETGPQRLCLFETKGQHLEGNSDTTYKQKLIETLEKSYRNATQHGTMDITAPNNRTMSFRMLFEDSWRQTVNETIAEVYEK